MGFMMQDRISMAHGAGGALMQSLIKDYILSNLGGIHAEVPLDALDDAAVIDGIVLKSDSYTVKPIFFPGGDIGSLAVSGTVNDISMLGAEPVALAMGLVIEEGLLLQDLDRILKSIKKTCEEASVFVATGDTKVMEKGSLDKIVINSSGIGRRCEALEHNLKVVRNFRNIDVSWLLDSNVRPGDKIVVSGTIGDHGIAILSAREGYGFEADVMSDARPLNKMVAKVLEVGGILAMKDPTRGGLSNALNEWARKSNVGMYIKEEKIPIRDGVRVACEMLGIDPLEIGNEGKAVIAVIPELAEDVLEVLRSTPEGRDAEIIGEATDTFDSVVLETVIGGKRILPPPIGDPVPRIC